jgi:Uma2 family endonuclease
MTTVILGEHPEVQTLIEQRRLRGQDTRDEVWEGVYYMTPHAHAHHGLVQIRLGRVLDDLATPRGLTVGAEFNLGTPDDYRVPDLGVHDGVPDGLYVATAALVAEILSPNDATFEKFGFYARHGVAEILVVDVDQRSIRIWQLDDSSPQSGGGQSGGQYAQTSESDLLGITGLQLQAMISWP